MVLEKTLESPSDCKEIQWVHPKGIQSWIFIGRNDTESEAPILWPPDVKSWLIWKDPDAGKDWMQEEKGTTEDETVRWHHWLNGHEFEYTPGAGDGQGSLACCSPWGHKESDMTERLSWLNSLYHPDKKFTELQIYYKHLLFKMHCLWAANLSYFRVNYSNIGGSRWNSGHKVSGAIKAESTATGKPQLRPWLCTTFTSRPHPHPDAFLGLALPITYCVIE